MASPRHGKYPFVLVVMAQTFPLCCSSSPGVQGCWGEGGSGLGGPAALPQCPPVLALSPGEHQVGPALNGVCGWVRCCQTVLGCPKF